MLGCGAPQELSEAAPCWEDRFPVRACAHPARPEYVGLWVYAEGDLPAFVYDGCDVSSRFVPSGSFTSPFRGFADAERELSVDIRDYADPYPYYREHAVWRDRLLHPDSILHHSLAEAAPDGSGMRSTNGRPLRRVDDLRGLSDEVLLLLCPRGRVPTEEELLDEHGMARDAERLPY